MNEKITNLLSAISDSRTKKYEEEIQRQKDAIEAALVKFLEERKAEIDELKRASIFQQNQNTLWFNFELDAAVLPEVADYISKEFQLVVDAHDDKKVYGQYQA